MMSNGEIKNHEELVIALTDIGMGEALCHKIVTCYEQGQMKQVRNFLVGYRKELLEGMHESQDKLYRIDFIIRKWNLA